MLFCHIEVLSVDDTDLRNEDWRSIFKTIRLKNKENITREHSHISIRKSYCDSLYSVRLRFGFGFH